MIRLLTILFIITLTSCEKEVKVNAVNSQYFDLPKYFAKESQILANGSLSLEKTATINQVRETRILKVKNWKKELSIFAAVELNKTAWRGKFKVIAAKNYTLYSCADKQVPVKSVLIRKEGDNIAGIKIVMRSNNLLYNNTEELIYIPNKSYSVFKSQKVKMLGEKTYKISGKLIKE